MVNFQKFINTIVIIFVISYLIQFIRNKKLRKKEDDDSNYFKDFNVDQNDENENEEKEIKDDLTLINKRNKQNKLNINLMNFLDSYNFDILDMKTIKKIETWKNKAYSYSGIERFSIALISTISAGKSSILNYILKLENNKLETGPKITTKCCVIIRDNKKYKKGKLFNVKVEKRGDIDKYNFIKQEEIKEDPKIFIEKRNELITKLWESKDEIKDIGLFFVILEIDTGLFEGELRKYSGFVEFIDVPGLDEIEGDFYFRNLLPFIKPNILFPILMLDATNFKSKDVFNVFNEMFNPYISKNLNITNNTKIQYDLDNQQYTLNISKNNSLILINKLNLCQKNERNEIKEDIIRTTSEKLNIPLNLDNNLFLINAKAKNLEVNKYKSFLNYTEYALNKGDLKEYSEILNILSQEFQKDFNYDIQQDLNKKVKNYKYRGNGKEFKILEKIIEEKNCRKGKFSKDHFYYFSNLFENLKKTHSLSFDRDGTIIINVIKNKIKYLIDKFLDDNSFEEIIKILKIDKNQLEDDYSFIESKNIKMAPLDLIQILNKQILKLKEIEISNDGINELESDYDNLIKYLNNKQFMHYLFSGPYSSGKSFTLNNIIGYNYYLLEFGSGETTNHAFIIRYNENINLYKANIVKNKYQYFFEKGELIAKGENSVREAIIKVNHNIKKFSIFILETPIQLFKDIQIKENLRNIIEFIDFPGLNTEKAQNNIDNQLFKIINAFFFLNKPNDIGCNSIDEVFKKIIKELVLKESNVDLKNCLILFTKNEKENQENFNNKNLIENAILNLIKNLKKDLELVDIENIKNKLNQTQMNYAKFSNIDYKNYIELTTIFETFKSYINYIIQILDKEWPDIKTLFEDIDLFIKEKFNFEKKKGQNGIGYFTSFFSKNPQHKKYDNENINENNKYINDFIEILNQKNLKGKNFLINIKEKNKIIEYFENYLIFKNNLKEFPEYKNSFYDEFKIKFIEIMNSTEFTINNMFNKYLNDIILKTVSVLQIINSKFEMNEEEFNKKYNIKENEKYIEKLNNNYYNCLSQKNAKLQNLKEEIDNIINNINKHDYKATEFKEEFEIVKNKIDKKIEEKSSQISEVYDTHKNYIDIIIKVLKSNKSNDDQFNIRNGNNIKRRYSFKNQNNFIIYGFWKNLFHNYEEDIKNAINDYKNTVNSGFVSINDDINNKFEELHEKGLEVINLIFKTAMSDFKNLTKNKEKYKKIFEEIKDLIKIHYF